MGTGSVHRVPQAVGTGEGAFVATAKHEAHMTASGVVGAQSNLSLEGGVGPSGRRGKCAQSYWPFHCLLKSCACHLRRSPSSWQESIHIDLLRHSCSIYYPTSINRSQ